MRLKIENEGYEIWKKYGRNSCQDELQNTGVGCKENLLGLPFLASSATGMDYMTCQNHFLVLCRCGFLLKLPTTIPILLWSISPRVSHIQKMYIPKGYSKFMLFVHIPSSEISFEMGSPKMTIQDST